MGKAKQANSQDICWPVFLLSESGLREPDFVLLCFPGKSIILLARFDFESLVGSPGMLAALTYVFVVCDLL